MHTMLSTAAEVQPAEALHSENQEISMLVSVMNLEVYIEKIKKEIKCLEKIFIAGIEISV